MKPEHSPADRTCAIEKQEKNSLELVLKLRQRRVRVLGLLTVASILLILGVAVHDKDADCDTKTKFVGRYAVCEDRKATVIHLIPKLKSDKPHVIDDAIHVLLSETEEFYYTPDGDYIKNFSLNLATGDKTFYERERK